MFPFPIWRVKTLHVGGSFFIAVQEYGKRGLAHKRSEASGNGVDPLLYTFIYHTSTTIWDRYRPALYSLSPCLQGHHSYHRQLVLRAIPTTQVRCGRGIESLPAYSHYPRPLRMVFRWVLENNSVDVAKR